MSLHSYAFTYLINIIDCLLELGNFYVVSINNIYWVPTIYQELFKVFICINPFNYMSKEEAASQYLKQYLKLNLLFVKQGGAVRLLE